MQPLDTVWIILLAFIIYFVYFKAGKEEKQKGKQ